MNAGEQIRVVIAGNPNSGKTTIFNQLTRSRQHVGNWPGKTVSCEQGYYSYKGLTFEAVDLPGSYSLAAYAQEQNLTRAYLLDACPDVVVVVLDASNLERHLYLAVQILEMGLPTVLALNMHDLAESQGQHLDQRALSDRLGGVPVVNVTAHKGYGVEALKAAVWTLAHDRGGNGRGPAVPVKLRYPLEIEKEIDHLERHLAGAGGLPAHVGSRWLALDLLTEGQQRLTSIEDRAGTPELRRALSESSERLRQSLDEQIGLHVADVRFSEAGRLAQEVLEKADVQNRSFADRIDRLVTHPLLGAPIFLAVMYLIFRLVVNVSAPYLDWIDSVVAGPLTSWSASILTALGAPLWLRALIVEGVIAGVGGVLVFLPGLIVLFLFIAILEDSGYLARAAFVMNRFLSFLGLNGRSFVPLILGFGCAVPAIYATRTLENRRDRLLTALMVPLMSCSARLPVYVLFGMALFGRRADQVIWGLYALGVLSAIGVGWLFSRTVLRGSETQEFLMELPRYRRPSLRGLWAHVSMRTRDFIEGAGTVILVASIVVWILLHIPFGVSSLEESAFGRASAAIAPVFEPAGFGTWEASASLMSGLVAKEVIVSSMSEIYLGSPLETLDPEPRFAEQLGAIGTGFAGATLEAGREVLETLTPGIRLFPAAASVSSNETALSKVLTTVFTPAGGLAFLVYVLLYTPCIATLSVIRSEFGGRWALFSAVYQSAIAWLAATAVFQLGGLLG